MKATMFIVLLAVCYIECRKAYKPIDKNANIDFINMETGGYGGGRPSVQPARPAPAQPTPSPVQPPPPPKSPTPAPTARPAVVTPPIPAPAKPAQPVQPQPTQIKPAPVNPTPATKPITTPGPGSVKQLVNFYDSQGKGSPIRPYSYSQAVKQG